MAEDGGARTPGDRSRRALLLLSSAALAAAGQLPETPRAKDDEKAGDLRLPNGKRQIDEILKADREQNLKEARELAAMATSFETEVEKTDRFVLSVSMVKKLDDMERLVRRIRSRMKK